MPRFLRTAVPALLALLCAGHNTGTAQSPEELLKSPESNFRVEGARRLLAQNSRKAVEQVLRAMQTESDGAAGKEMGLEFKQLTSPEAISAAEKGIGSPRKPGEVFTAYWALTGLAKGATEPGDGVLRNALKKGHASEISLRACALEAIGASLRHELSDLLVPLLKEVTPAIDKGNMFETLALLSAARALGMERVPENRKPLLEGLIHVLEQSADERIEYFTAHALGKLTDQPPYTDPNWWRAYLVKGSPDPTQEGRTIARPSFFNTVAVGKRILFVVDISGSMEWPAKMGPKGGGPETGSNREKGEGPDYSNVRTKLDLAKVELIWTLSKLPEDMSFNVIVYETKHRLIDEAIEGMVVANQANKAKFTSSVLALKANGGTNIHGSLTRAMCITRRPPAVQGDPALDKRAMLEGADTIFFLTDGRPSWSDDSTGYGEVHPKWGSIGNGRFCKPAEILADITRVNTFRKVVIHTVGISEDHDKDLMEKLALHNHGQYVARG